MKPESMPVFLHPLRSVSDYSRDRALRRQAMARRVLGWMAALVVVGGGLLAAAEKGWL